MELPEEAIRHLVRSAGTNWELACLSNVSRKWREIAVSVILEQGHDALKGSSDADADESRLLLLPSMVRYVLCQQKSTDNDVESFCIAWFHPDGMEIKQLSLDAADASHDESETDHADSMWPSDHRHDHSPEPFAPSGGPSYAGSEEEGKGPNRRNRVRSGSPTPLFAAVGAGLKKLQTATEHVSCMYQWNGYKEAMDVLKPFGYARRFVERVLDLAKADSNGMQVDYSPPAETDSRKLRFSEQSTYAVRGATLARPEGYCLCWDLDRPQINQDAGKTDARQQQEYRQLLRRRNRRRRELQREVLPRVLCSTPYKDPFDPLKSGNVQPCIQFLNVDASHAVRLFTPPFKHGPIPTPITIFCVAIATEDGCFLSGLKNRFEFGHLYPETAPDNLIERSPICICTDVVKKQRTKKTDQNGQYGKYGGDSSNSDDSSCGMSLDAVGGEAGSKCVCPYSGIGADSDADDGEEDDPVVLYRGRRGPGSWHCYTAIFDGDSSVIRIDGNSEPLHSNTARLESFAASLDGLTIGADHTFDMSLCFGQGSDGEGEGAMSELVAFKGKLGHADIQVMESLLMEKHGILEPSKSESVVAQEDQWIRQAHALLEHAPNHQIFGSANNKRVPLRYMARHRSVAWRQSNPVTGESIKVQRIGSKFGESSSDW